MRAAIHAAAHAIIAESLGVRVVEATVKGWFVESAVKFANPPGQHHHAIELAGTVAESVLLGDGSTAFDGLEGIIAAVLADPLVHSAVRHVAARLNTSRKLSRRELFDLCDGAVRTRVQRHLDAVEAS